MEVVRLHHNGDDGYRNMQGEAPFCLLLDECPIALTSLRILLRLRRVIERELDVMEGSQFIVRQNSNTMTIGSDGELDRFRLQVAQDCLKVGMHAVLTGAEIHGTNRQALHHCFDLIQGKTIGARGISIAEGAREITLVRESEPERNTSIRRHHSRSGR